MKDLLPVRVTISLAHCHSLVVASSNFSHMCTYTHLLVISFVTLHLVAMFLSFTFMPINLHLFACETKYVSYTCANVRSIGTLQ